MALPWFRLYSEFVSDPKIQLLAFEDQRHFVAILCLKCNGTLDTSAANSVHFERLICKALGLDPTTGSEAKRRLIEVGLIGQDWQPIAWEKRQYSSDSSTKRTQKWREKQKGTSRERHSDVNVTDKNRTEQIQNRLRTDKNTTASAPPIEFEELKKSYPKRSGDQGWSKAVKACNARLSEGYSWEDLLAGTHRYAEWCRQTGKVGTEYVKQAGTFFGPDKHFLTEWTAPANKAEVVRDQNIDISRQWLAKQEQQDATR